MQIVKTLKVTPDEIFDAIEASVLDDYERACGKSISAKKIKGLKYSKVMGEGSRKQTKMRVKVMNYRRPEVYRARFSYDDAIDEVSYEVEPNEEGLAILTYTEEMRTTRPVTGLRGKLNLAIYEQRVRSRANRTIRALERAVEQGRQELNNPLLDELEAKEPEDEPAAHEPEGAPADGDPQAPEAAE